jgi:starvation-inducible DNA-binding protein
MPFSSMILPSTLSAGHAVRGPSIIALHELFDGINEAVEDYLDDIAQRAVQLGGVAEGTARMVAKRTSLREYPANAVGGHGHVDALSAALAAFGAAVRKAINQAKRTG